MMSRSRNLKILLLVLVVGGLYFFTLAPDVYLEDSGELITASYFLGIAHPSGYPLYLLLGKLFSFLPFGTIAFRLNLMSSIFGVATAVFLFLAMRELAENLSQKNKISDWLAFALAVLFGVSRDFWSQAIVAEVYTLNTFLVSLVLYLFLKWRRNPLASEKYLCLLAFTSGLGLTNHQLFAFILPVIWALVFSQRAWLTSQKQVFKLIVLFVLGFSIYLYIPIRLASHPQVNFNHIATIFDSINHILRTFYHDFGLGIERKFAFLSSYIQSLALNFSYFIVLVSAAALVVLRNKREYEISILLVGGFLLSVFPPIFLRSTTFFIGAEFTYRVYYFQSYVFILLLAFIFLNQFARFQKFLFIGLIILATAMIYKNFSAVNLQDNPVSPYYERKLESLAPNAVFLTDSEGYDSDSEIFILLYLQKVRGIRPDVTIIDTAEIFHIPDLALAKDMKREGFQFLLIRRLRFLKYFVSRYGFQNPLYASFPVETYSKTLVSRPSGYTVAIFPKESSQELAAKGDYSADFGFYSLRSEREKWDLAYQDFLAASFYQQALLWQRKGDKKHQLESIVLAINFDNEAYSEDYQAFRGYRARLTSLPK